MKSTIIFAVVVAASITPTMAWDTRSDQIERELFYQQEETRERLHRQEQQLRNLELQQSQERWR